MTEIDTPRGPARLHVDADAGSRGVLVLGHGAGGGVEALDLLAACAGARDGGFCVVRVEQPWRVAGRRIAEAPAKLDEAWVVAVRAVRRSSFGGAAGTPFVLGGRSSGARVACRTATGLGATGVLALAFPLLPPGGRVSRAAELAAASVPRLVVQGGRDAFGIPAAAAGVRVEVVAGADHAFQVRRRDGRSRDEVLDQVRAAVGGWLAALLSTPELIP